MICAPRLAASSIFAIALSRLSRGSAAQLIWMSPTTTLSAFDAMTIVIATAQVPRYREQDDRRIFKGSETYLCIRSCGHERIRDLRLHERGCDTVIGRAKEKRDG